MARRRVQTPPNDVIPPGELIVQPHGGALRPRPPAFGGSSWKAAKKQALAELAAMTPAAMDRLWQLIHDPDSRVAFAASQELMNRVFGRPAETPQIAGTENTAIRDLSHLSADQLRQLKSAIETVRALAGAAPEILPPE